MIADFSLQGKSISYPPLSKALNPGFLQGTVSITKYAVFNCDITEIICFQLWLCGNKLKLYFNKAISHKRQRITAKCLIAAQNGLPKTLISVCSHICAHIGWWLGL